MLPMLKKIVAEKGICCIEQMKDVVKDFVGFSQCASYNRNTEYTGIYSDDIIHFKNSKVRIYHYVFFGQVEIDAEEIDLYDCIFFGCLMIKSANVKLTITACNFSGVFFDKSNIELVLSRARFYRLQIDECMIGVEKYDDDISIDKLSDKNTKYLNHQLYGGKASPFYGPRDEHWFFEFF